MLALAMMFFLASRFVHIRSKTNAIRVEVECRGELEAGNLYRSLVQQTVLLR